MVQCEVDPSIYFKIDFDNEGAVRGYLVAITWVDDVRYIGTPSMIEAYEATVQQHVKCTMEGVCDEFVSINMKHDLKAGTVELTQAEYWEKAVAKFSEFLAPSGPKERTVPLSIADAALLTEATEEDVKKGMHLPYPQLLGTIQYPSAYTKLEMRFTISILSRHRGKWGERHFAAALKALEYGYTTRARGIKYTRPRDEKLTNLLLAYADSGFSAPRSQGCRLVMMNGGAISFASKRHTTTDDSTAAAELTEQHLCACDVEGLRNLMSEIGLHQERPTIIYQDNTAAIQIAMNRGSLAKKTRSMDMRTLSVRNKIEDGKVLPVWLDTTKMIADIGTKALDRVAFERLRDILCGYKVEESSGRHGDEVSMLMWLAKHCAHDFTTCRR